jgi:predicted transcriptional regulator
MTEQAEKLALVAEIASSYMSRNKVPQDQISSIVASVTNALQAAASELSGEAPPSSSEAASVEKPTPAVPVRSSVKPDAITCLECGAKQKTLKRHLSTAHNLTPAEYRSKWGLKKEYPMVAPSYSAQRSTMAKKIGLGAIGRNRSRRKTMNKAKPASKAA